MSREAGSGKREGDPSLPLGTGREQGTGNSGSGVDRRSALKAMAAAAAVPVLGTFETSEEHLLRAREAAQSAVLGEMQGTAYTPKFFTPHEYQTVRVLGTLLFCWAALNPVSRSAALSRRT